MYRNLHSTRIYCASKYFPGFTCLPGSFRLLQHTDLLMFTTRVSLVIRDVVFSHSSDFVRAGKQTETA